MLDLFVGAGVFESIVFFQGIPREHATLLVKFCDQLSLAKRRVRLMTVWSLAFSGSNVGALIVRIGFWGPLY